MNGPAVPHNHIFTTATFGGGVSLLWLMLSAPPPASRVFSFRSRNIRLNLTQMIGHSPQVLQRASLHERLLHGHQIGSGAAIATQRLVGTLQSWHNPSMTTTVDQKHRAVIPFDPGDVLEIQQQSPDVVVLKRTKQAESARANLVRRNGRLVFVGEPVTTEEVKGLLDDFP